MKKIFRLFALCSLLSSLVLTGCTMPWQKTAPETETVVTETENPETATKPIEPVVQKDITPSDTPKAIAEGGVYMPYTSTAVAQAKGQVVLFFHANWCPTCTAINKDMVANLAKIPTDLTILKVNYDDEKELKELYEVTAQHTFVQVDNTGKLIKKWRGGVSLDEILSEVQR